MFSGAVIPSNYHRYKPTNEGCYLLTVVDFLAGELEDRPPLDKLLRRCLAAGDCLLPDDSSLLSRTRCRLDDCFAVGPFLDDDGALSSDKCLELVRDTGLLLGFT